MIIDRDYVVIDTKPFSLWGIMTGVGGVWKYGVRKSIHQSWLAKGLGLRLLCWGFKGVQEEILSEEAITLEIGSVAFPPGQYTDYLTKMGIKTVHHRLYRPDLAAWNFCLFPKLRGCRYETFAEMKRLWRKSLTRSHKRTSTGPSRSCWNGTTNALQLEDITSKGTRVSCVYYQ